MIRPLDINEIWKIQKYIRDVKGFYTPVLVFGKTDDPNFSIENVRSVHNAYRYLTNSGKMKSYTGSTADDLLISKNLDPYSTVWGFRVTTIMNSVMEMARAGDLPTELVFFESAKAKEEQKEIDKESGIRFSFPKINTKKITETANTAKVIGLITAGVVVYALYTTNKVASKF